MVQILLFFLENNATRSAEFEPATYGLEVWRSIKLALYRGFLVPAPTATGLVAVARWGD